MDQTNGWWVLSDQKRRRWSQELRDILKVLESGKEGRWPELEKHTEAKLLTVLPESERKKILRLKRINI